MRIPKPCLSVCPSICPYPEKRNNPGFVNISLTLVIDTSMEMSPRVLQHGNSKIKKKKIQKSSKFEFWLATKSWNHLSFVNISPTLVIDHQWKGIYENCSMETQKLKKNPKKLEIRILTCDEDMHLYDDIRDASSFLWGSTSSLIYIQINFLFVQSFLLLCYLVCSPCKIIYS